MKPSGLRLWEKIFIYFRCHHDTRFGLFWRSDTGELITERTLRSVTEPLTNAVSSFIIQELSHLVAKTKRTCGKKRYRIRNIFRLQTNFSINWFFKRFSDAMALIDCCIDQLESEIYQQNKVHQKTIYQFMKKQTEKKNTNSYQAQMYKNEIEDEHERHNTELIAQYNEKADLLIEKLRLIKLINASIERTKVRHFLRIQYYYSTACDILAKRLSRADANSAQSIIVLPLIHFTDEYLSRLCNNAIDQVYIDFLIETEKELEETKELLSDLSPIQTDGDEESMENTDESLSQVPSV